jgi:hypothetical protein
MKAKNKRRRRRRRKRRKKKKRLLLGRSRYLLRSWGLGPGAWYGDIL